MGRRRGRRSEPTWWRQTPRAASCCQCLWSSSFCCKLRGSPSQEHRLLPLFPKVSLGLGVKGSKGRRAVTRTGGGSAASRPLATSGCLDPWGGNLGPSPPGPAPTAASGHPVPPLGLHRSRPQPRAGWDPLPPVLRKCHLPSDPSLAQLQSSPSHVPSSPLSSASLSSRSRLYLPWSLHSGSDFLSQPLKVYSLIPSTLRLSLQLTLY